MLKGLDPLLGPDLLHVLRAMGHGDSLALVDRNFPATALASRVIRLDGVDNARAAAAILSVLPIDDFRHPAVHRMEVVGDPDALPAVQSQMTELLRDFGYSEPMSGLERFAFYDRTRSAFAAVVTGETQPYGCFLIAKGVVR